MYMYVCMCKYAYVRMLYVRLQATSTVWGAVNFVAWCVEPILPRTLPLCRIVSTILYAHTHYHST